MNKITIIKIDNNTIENINLLEQGTKFILTTNEENVNLNGINVEHEFDVVIYNTIMKDGYVYKKNIKTLDFKDVKHFISVYKNICGIIFTKKQQIKSYEDLFEGSFKVYSNISITVNDIYLINEQIPNLEENQDVLNLDYVLSGEKEATGLYTSHKFRKLCNEYGYNEIIKAIEANYEGKLSNQRFKKLKAKYANEYTYLNLYQALEKSYYIEDKQGVFND